MTLTDGQMSGRTDEWMVRHKDRERWVDGKTVRRTDILTNEQAVRQSDGKMVRRTD
jgi:hypothetical protein